MRGLCLPAAVLVFIAGSFACATAVPPAATPSAPAYMEYVFPQPPAKGGDPRLAAQHQQAWALLQSGNLVGAVNEYAALVKRAPGYLPAEVGLGYVLLAQQKTKDAMAWFDHAIRVAPGYAPAYAGRGEGYLAAGQRDLALASFEAAIKIDPKLADLNRRVEVIRFARVRELVASAKRAADQGQLEEARQSYADAVNASPDSAVLYRDLGVVEGRLNLMADAVQHLRKSVVLDGGDSRALTALGDALERQGDIEGAVDAYQRAVAIDSLDTTRKTLERLRDRASITRFPTEYGSIPRLTQVTRGDLAALLGIRLQPLLATASRGGAAVLATDVRGHWASTWIMAVTKANVMEVYANHTFQPAAGVRRVDMAQVVARVVTMVSPGLAKSFVRPVIGDVPADHLSYPDVALAVASGLMGLVDNGLFRPSRPLSGAEAVDILDRLERLAKRPRTGMGGGDR